MEFNVLSLFDGCSGGQQALDRIGKKVDTYYASEIDKYAITVTMANYPNTIQLGSVTEVDVSKLKPISLLIGGSPCQSFSFAGKRKGMSTKDNIEILALEHYLELKEQKFEFEGQSYLFWEYMRILTDIRKYNPDVKFLLENVMMGEKWQKILTRAIGINPIEINSALVSAQNRRRLYWTNIGAEQDGLFEDLKCMIPQPKDRGILLKDILEPEVDEKYYLSDKMLQYFSNRAANFNQGKVNVREEEGKASCLTSSMASCDISDNFIKVDTNLKKSANQDKANCFTAGGNSCGFHSDMTLIVASRGRNPENPKSREIGLNTEQHLEPRFDGKTNCLTSVQKDNLVMLNERQKANHKNEDEKANTFLSTSWKGSQANGMTLVGTTKIRRLTPTECERLQTVPDGYTDCVSDTQRYRMLGNGWTVDVIAHFFVFLKGEEKKLFKTEPKC